MCDEIARSSIHTSQLRLAAHACVRNFGMMDPVYPKEKIKDGWGDGMEWWEVDVVRASFEVLVVGECGGA